MLQSRPRRRHGARWAGITAALLLAGLLFAPLLVVGGIAVLTASLFTTDQASGATEDFDAELVAAAQAASQRCESATPARLLAIVSLPPPTDQAPGTDADDTVTAWGALLSSSNQYDALRDDDDPELDTATTDGVVDAVAVIWCALYPQIAEADLDAAATTTYLALGTATSAAEAIQQQSAVDLTRGQQFEALAAQYSEALLLATTSAAGSISAQGWTHPIPGMATYQGNYGQVRNGYIHAGEDLSAPMGTPIYAAAGGVVTRASCLAFEGRSPCNVIIDHGTDPVTGRHVQTWYVHMYAPGVLVDAGQSVTVGQQIALTGSNGNSTGPHLHLEVHLDGQVTDPTVFFAEHGVDLRHPSTAPTVTAAAARALHWARTQIGAPYELGGTGPNSFDCSGLTMGAYLSAGVTLPRTSREQYAATARITAAELQPGDLIFWSTDGTSAGVYHVALYAGNDRIMQAPAPGKTVEDQTLWLEDLFGYGRVT